MGTSGARKKEGILLTQLQCMAIVNIKERERWERE